ncbi:hypothetical protein GAH_01920 [Geoglobus ahangari]|uniref:DUF502 domain-containing protein n=1 Tax=Geoglobus ahangari TaxID=113653 RepID=A0A0F7IFY8_9EURY|nr:DUF502 domain-containing protein [Geoglobus ahangari]AKG90807.1 hypothetical protein GAH_01920 [Geoglobus ahangari]
MLERLRNTFITGLLIFLPLATTVFIIYWAVMAVENLMSPAIRASPYYFPGMSVLLLVLVILALGAFGTHAIGQKAILKVEQWLKRVPIVRTVYVGVKEALKAVVESDVERLKGVVLVEYPRKGVYAIGFTSGSRIEVAEKSTGKRLVNVFIPTSPNPTSGLVVLVPEDELIYLDISVEEAMKIVISGGFSGT